MPYSFDRIIDRRAVDGRNKWTWYPTDVLPMWVADMDFLTPEPILQAAERALKHGVLGYEMPGKPLLETVAARMEKLYGWKIGPEMVLAIPGVNAGLAAVTRMFSEPGDGVLIQPPIYPPFLHAPKLMGRVAQSAQLKRTASGAALRYAIDFDAFERAIDSRGAKTKAILFCNPHNPSGRAFRRDELERLARICRKHDLLICSDEIHSELLLEGAPHLPVATLAPAVAERSITLISPSKTFNMPGLFCAFAIVPNARLRKKLATELERTSLHVNNLGLAAARVAFSGACDDWLAALRDYLKANRDMAVEFIRSELPGIRSTVPEATYLLWLDCSELVRAGRIAGSPYEFILKRGKLALNKGEEFGPGGKGFVRLNFGCPRATLEEGLNRLKQALVS